MMMVLRLLNLLESPLIKSLVLVGDVRGDNFPLCDDDHPSNQWIIVRWRF